MPVRTAPSVPMPRRGAPLLCVQAPARDKGLTARPVQLCLTPRRFGWVAEWFKAPVLKTGVLARVPGVRIPPHPPTLLE